jgi:hypothetical protein
MKSKQYFLDIAKGGLNGGNPQRAESSRGYDASADQAPIGTTANPTDEDWRVYHSNGNADESGRGEGSGLHLSNGSGVDASPTTGPEHWASRERDGSTDQAGGIKVRTSKFDQVFSYLGRKKNSQPSKTRKTQSKNGTRLLTSAKATQQRDVLCQFFLDCTDNMDVAISAVTKGHRDVVIWSSIEQKDAYIVVDMLQQEAQHSLKAAAAVEYIMRMRLRIKAGQILLPRVAATLVYIFTTGVSIRI